MKLEEAINKCKKFYEYEDSLVLTDNVLYEYQEAIETIIQALEDSIPKRKIEYKLEELYTHYTKLKGWKNNEVVIKYHSDVRVLKELLEE